jgi:hypothetical protein
MANKLSLKVFKAICGGTNTKRSFNMNKKLIFLAMLVSLLAFGVIVSGCDNGTTTNPSSGLSNNNNGVSGGTSGGQTSHKHPRFPAYHKAGAGRYHHEQCHENH